MSRPRVRAVPEVDRPYFAQLSAAIIQEAGAHGVEIAIEHALRVRGLVIGAQILHHLVGLQHIGADLVAPARITLGIMGLADGGVALVEFKLVEPRAQGIHGDVAVLVLRFQR